MSLPLIESDINEIVGRLGSASTRFAGKTIVLAGGAGFLGRYFREVVAFLNENVLKAPCRLIALDSFITTLRDSSTLRGDPNQRLIEHDVRNPFDPEQKVDFVVQAAGIASPFHYRAHPLETLEVAISGTKNLLELATQQRARFLFFSSSEIYGDPDPRYIPTPESYRGNVSCLGPRACYDESKRLGETLCYVYHEQSGTSTNQVRPFNVYGPGMAQDDYRALPNFASQIKRNKTLTIYGSGTQTRTFCYVTDAVLGFLLIMLNGVPGEAYNIGQATPEVSILELVARIGRVLNRDIPHRVIAYPDTYPPDEPNRRCPDIRKAQVQLQFRPKVGLDEGLRRFFDWTDRHYLAED